jgi:hypothetical protein
MTGMPTEVERQPNSKLSEPQLAGREGGGWGTGQHSDTVKGCGGGGVWSQLPTSCVCTVVMHWIHCCQAKLKQAHLQILPKSNMHSFCCSTAPRLCTVFH